MVKEAPLTSLVWRDIFIRRVSFGAPRGSMLSLPWGGRRGRRYRSRCKSGDAAPNQAGPELRSEEPGPEMVLILTSGHSFVSGAAQMGLVRLKDPGLILGQIIVEKGNG